MGLLQIVPYFLKKLRNYDHLSSFQNILTSSKGRNHGWGGSSIVEVNGDVPPTRVYFFRTSSLAKGMLFDNFFLYIKLYIYIYIS